jgi:predicted amino acid-binding ACT domain protein
MIRPDRSRIVAAITRALADDSDNIEDTPTTSSARRC